MKLSDTFASPESRVYRVVMFVDMSDSTTMKEKEAEASWLTTYGWFFDKIAESIEGFGGIIVKYLGDGVMAVFDDEHAAEAINAAIRIQEEIAIGTENRRVVLHCCVGIATGEVVEFQTARGDTDYIGTVVDRASRLCGAASPKAIFVDKSTIATALMRKVKSRLGEARAPRRSVDDYQGTPQKIVLKGLSTVVEYHEIFWDQQLYGVKSVVQTEALNSGRVQKEEPSSNISNTSKSDQEYCTGTIRKWDTDRRSGFIMSDRNEFFYFNERYMAGLVELKEGDQVFFVARDALSPGKNRVAAGVIVRGKPMQGEVTHVGGRGFGFVRVGDLQGNFWDLFMFVGDNPEGFTRGDRVNFIVGQNQRGAVAENVHRANR